VRNKINKNRKEKCRVEIWVFISRETGIKKEETIKKKSIVNKFFVTNK